MRLYGNHLSGNCYKPWAMARLRGLDLDYQEVDILKGEAKAESFRQRNLDGRVPVLELEDGRCLPESNAILCYLAEGSEFLPMDAWQRAEVMRWLFFEQNAHEPFLASSRFLLALSGESKKHAARIEMLHGRGTEALAVLDQQLGQSAWLAGGQFSVADLALYPYTSVADEGGFSLNPYPAVQDWLSRVESIPGLPPFSAFLAGT
jgi:glutathione S-transferase